MALTDNQLNSVVHVEKRIRRACDHLSHRELPLTTGKGVHGTSSQEDGARRLRGSDVPGVLGCDSSVYKAPFKGVKGKTLLILVKMVQETRFKMTVIGERLTGAPQLRLCSQGAEQGGRRTENH